MKFHVVKPVSRSSITDVQGSPDHREIAIDKVGIRELRHPVAVRDREEHVQHTIATFGMFVELPHHVKGTHMSRFIDILNRHEEPISIDNFDTLLVEMVGRLGAVHGDIEMCFPFFVRKKAPISKVESYSDYDVTLTGTIHNGDCELITQIVVPVTSLCPCSKEISDYGAHNQRSHIVVEIVSREPMWLEEVIETVEQQASCELYGVLKRDDEKYVTEKAYDNPKFVEDVVRDVAAVLSQDGRIERYTVTVENFESIHNHSAFAQISRNRQNEN